MIDQFRFCLTYSGFISSNTTPFHGISVRAYVTFWREKSQIMCKKCAKICILHVANLVQECAMTCTYRGK